MHHDGRSKDQIMHALYADRMTDETPEPKIVDVYICKLRAKLGRYDLTIETLWGRGYQLSLKTKDLLRAMAAGGRA